MFRFKHDVSQINKLLHDVFIGEMKLEKAPQCSEEQYEFEQFDDHYVKDLHPVVILSEKYRQKLVAHVENSLRAADEKKDAAAFDQAKNPALFLYLVLYCSFVQRNRMSFGNSNDTLIRIKNAAEENNDLLTSAYLTITAPDADDSDEAQKSLRIAEQQMRAIVLQKLQAKLTLTSDETSLTQSALDNLELYDLTALAEDCVTDNSVFKILNHIAIEKNNETLARKLVDSFALNDKQLTYIFCDMCSRHFRYKKDWVDIETINRLAKFCLPTSEISQARMLQMIIKNFHLRLKETANPAVRKKLTDDLFHILNILVSNKVNINAQDENGNTVINYCCQIFKSETVEIMTLNGLKQILHFFASKGADFNIANHKGDTPLHSAAGHCTSDLVAMMLEELKGIKADAKNAAGHTPIVAAAVKCMETSQDAEYRHFVHTLRRFLVNRKDSNREERNKVLLLAVEKGDTEMVRIMLDHGADCAIKTADKKTLLMLAKTLFTPENKAESEVKTVASAATSEPEAKVLSLDAATSPQPKETKAQVISPARYAALMTQLERDENPETNIWNLSFGPVTAKAHATGIMPDFLKQLKKFAGPMNIMTAFAGTVAQERSPLIAREFDFKKPVEEKDIDKILQILDPEQNNEYLNKTELYSKYKDHTGVFAFLHIGYGDRIKAKMTEAITTVRNPHLSKEDRARLIVDYNIMLSFLLKGADASDKLWLKQHLLSAINANNRYLVEILLKAEVDPNAKKDYTPAINLAISLGNPDLVRLLLREEKLDLTATDAYGITAFMEAANMSILTDDLVAEVILLMVMQKCKEKHVPFNLQTPNGETALTLAASAGNPVIMKALLDFAKRESGDVLGIHMQESPFKQRVLHRLLTSTFTRGYVVRPYYAEILLATGAQKDINAQDCNGNTALMQALLSQHRDEALVLLKHGADPHIQNYNDEDAFTLSYYREDPLQPILDQALQQARLQFEEADKRSAQAAIRMPSVYTAPRKTQQTDAPSFERKRGARS